MMSKTCFRPNHVQTNLLNSNRKIKRITRMSYIDTLNKNMLLMVFGVSLSTFQVYRDSGQDPVLRYVIQSVCLLCGGENILV